MRKTKTISYEAMCQALAAGIITAMASGVLESMKDISRSSQKADTLSKMASQACLTLEELEGIDGLKTMERIMELVDQRERW